jgi:hypothetical protein
MAALNALTRTHAQQRHYAGQSLKLLPDHPRRIVVP